MMLNWTRWALALALGLTGALVQAHIFSKAFVDRSGHIRLVSPSGQTTRLPQSARAQRVVLSPDGQTVAWQDRPVRGESGVGTLHVFTAGARQTIVCEPFIRDFWFWQQGASIAIDCGGLHFAGAAILYALPGLQKLESVGPEVALDQRPDWANAGTLGN